MAAKEEDRGEKLIPESILQILVEFEIVFHKPQGCHILGGRIMISDLKEPIQILWLPTDFWVLVTKWVYMKHCGITILLII